MSLGLVGFGSVDRFLFERIREKCLIFFIYQKYLIDLS